MRIAARHGNDDFGISLSRLSDIETKGVLPSIYRLYSLAVIYRRDVREILAWYGIDLNDVATDLSLAEPPRSHRIDALESANTVRVPIKLDPGFDARRTSNLGRMIEKWGLVPLSFLAQLEGDKYSYGYIGTEDFTMYPLILPGSFVQVDEARVKIADGAWRSEYERPIYFVETRDGFCCCWCAEKESMLILQPHPLSPCTVRVLKTPQDAEVVGQIVGVAMRLGDWKPDSGPASRERAALN